MYTLYHYPICPRSRFARVILAEKKVPFNLISVDFWQQSKELRRLNPMLSIPFLIGENGVRIVGVTNISDYFEDLNQGVNSLMPESAEERAEVRRIVMWIDDKMYHEATKIILHERVFKFFESGMQANHKVLSFCRAQFPYHLQYFNFLLKNRQYLAGNDITIADFAVASHLSSLDFFGEIRWESYKDLSDWYAAIKSRQSFRSLLEDKLHGFKAAPHYAKLDF